MHLFSIILISGGPISILKAQSINEEKKIKAVEIILQVYCESEQAEASELRNHIQYIQDLSVQKLGFKSKADEKAHANQLDQRRKNFKQKIWSSVEKKGHKKSEMMKILKKIDLYTDGGQILEKANASCSLASTEKMILIGELI